MKKIIASVLCFTMCAAMFAGCKSDDGSTTTTTSGANGGGEGSTTTTVQEVIGTGDKEIKVYAMSPEVPGMIEEYAKRNPDFASTYKINATTITNTDSAYELALNAALTAGGDEAPDLYVAEADYILPYTQGEFMDFAAPYSDFIDDVDGKLKAADIAQYTVELGTNTDGKLVALCYQCTGGAFIYRRSIAKEVFGSDDPETVQEAIGAGTQSWDKFWDAADKLKAAGYAIVSGADDIWNVVEKASSQPWVVDGKLVIDPMRDQYLDIYKKLVDNGYSNNTDSWSEAWKADMAGLGEKQVFGFFGPAWLINYTIGENCGGEDGTYGDWAVCVPPVGFWWGGSWLCVNKAALEDEEKKAAISALVEWITLDCTEDGLLYAWANGLLNENGTKDTVSSGTVMKMSDGSMGILDGQNPFEIFVDATKYASAKCKCEYDSTFNGAFKDQAKAYANGEKSRDEAINEFKNKVYEAGVEI